MRPLPFMIVARTVAASSRPGHVQQGRPARCAASVRPVADGALALVRGGAGRSAGLRVLDQVEDGRVVLADDVDGAVGRLRRRVPEERAAVAARDVQRVVEMDGGEQSLIARRGEALLELLAFRVADDRMRIDVVDGERLLAEGRRRCRERLRRPGLFTRHVALRYRALLDRPDRRAGHAIEDVEEPGLASDRDRRRCSCRSA